MLMINLIRGFRAGSTFCEAYFLYILQILSSDQILKNFQLKIKDFQVIMNLIGGLASEASRGTPAPSLKNPHRGILGFFASFKFHWGFGGFVLF